MGGHLVSASARRKPVFRRIHHPRNRPPLHRRNRTLRSLLQVGRASGHPEPVLGHRRRRAPHGRRPGVRRFDRGTPGEAREAGRALLRGVGSSPHGRRPLPERPDATDVDADPRARRRALWRRARARADHHTRPPDDDRDGIARLGDHEREPYPPPRFCRPRPRPRRRERTDLPGLLAPRARRRVGRDERPSVAPPLHRRGDRRTEEGLLAVESNTQGIRIGENMIIPGAFKA